MVYPGDQGIPQSLFSNDYSAFAPRVGFAYDVRGNARTVLRAGYGIFYIDPALTLYTRTVSTQPSVLTVNITNPYNFQNPYQGVAGGNPYPFPRVQPEQFATFKYVKPVSGGVLDPAAKKGYSQNWNITLEQQVLKDLSLSFAYVGNKGSDILGAVEMNPAVYGPGATTGNTNARRIYSGISAMEMATPFQKSKYDAFQFTATKRAAKGLSILGTYVYAVNRDNSSSTIEGTGSYPRSTWDPNIDWAYSDFDVRHRMNLSVNYDIPGKLNGAAGAILNDWQVNAIVFARTGLPFTVKSGTDRSLSAIGQDNADRVGDPGSPNGLQWFNPAAFAAATLGTFGNEPRNSMQGPAYFTVDFALAKNIPISKFKLQFRLETFNLFNRVNYNNPNSTVSAGSNFGKLLTAQDPRVIQLGLKMIF
jgi:hypothetical protein